MAVHLSAQYPTPEGEWANLYRSDNGSPIWVTCTKRREDAEQVVATTSSLQPRSATWWGRTWRAQGLGGNRFESREMDLLAALGPLMPDRAVEAVRRIPLLMSSDISKCLANPDTIADSLLILTMALDASVEDRSKVWDAAGRAFERLSEVPVPHFDRDARIAAIDKVVSDRLILGG